MPGTAAGNERGLIFDAGARASLLDAIELHPDDFTPEVIAAIEAAEDAAMSSVAKFGTMLDRVSADGRLRGAFVMNGASQTGRFSSHGRAAAQLPAARGRRPRRAARQAHAHATSSMAACSPL